MYKRHVYVNGSKLTPEFIAQKHQITSKPGARYVFATGEIDPVSIAIAENAPPNQKRKWR